MAAGYVKMGLAAVFALAMATAAGAQATAPKASRADSGSRVSRTWSPRAKDILGGAARANASQPTHANTANHGLTPAANQFALAIQIMQSRTFVYR